MGRPKLLKKQLRTESAHRRKNCPAYCDLIGRSRSTQKVGVEKEYKGGSENKRRMDRGKDPKINDTRQDLGNKKKFPRSHSHNIILSIALLP
ncbi:hypothetical protein TNCV_3007611 [Trichonephila clavipes]|nr:hypothetical protein TNCV_3007611 [Trichonephila clavipes]